MHVCVCMMWMSSPKALHLIFWDRLSPTTQIVLIWLSWLDSELGDLPLSTTQCMNAAMWPHPTFTQMLGIWTPVLKFARWELYGLSYLQAALIYLKLKTEQFLKASRGKGHIVIKKWFVWLEVPHSKSQRPAANAPACFKYWRKLSIQVYIQKNSNYSLSGLK